MNLLKKIPKKQFLIIIATTFIFCFSFVSYFVVKISAQNILATSIKKSLVATPTSKTSVQNNSVVPIKKSLATTYISKIKTALPIRIKIPKLKINATIESIGLTADGSVDSPVGPNNAGWYNLGPIPGAIGSAIIDGHSGWKNNIPAIFDNLKDLKPGYKIYVENSDGTVTTFIVKKLKIYDKNDPALDVFISNDNKAHLNLITCTGVWDNVSKGRLSRVVVFSDVEQSIVSVKK